MCAREALNRIAIYGGAFDPLHTGHKHIVAWLLQHDWITWIVPTACPHHKPAGPSQSFEQRVAMLTAYLSGLPSNWQARTRILTAEKDNPDIAGRTQRLLQDLDATYGQQRWSLVVGADEWYNLEHWFRLPDWFSAVDWIVFPRHAPWEDSRPWPLPPCARHTSYQTSTLPDSEGWQLHNYHHSILFVNSVLSDHSSTALRST